MYFLFLFFYVNASFIYLILFRPPCQHIFTTKHFLLLVALSTFMDPDWRSCTADAPRTKLAQAARVLERGAYYPTGEDAARFLPLTVLKRDCRLPARATASARRATHHQHHRRRRRPASVVNKPYSHFLSYSHCISPSPLSSSPCLSPSRYTFPYIFLPCTPYIATSRVQIFLPPVSLSPCLHKFSFKTTPSA